MKKDTSSNLKCDIVKVFLCLRPFFVKISSTSSPHKSSSRSFSRLSFEDSYDDFDFLGPFVMDEDELMDLGDPARLLSLIEKLPSADPAVKLLLEMLVNKRVLEVVKEVMPEEHMKLITNIRK
nr:hypothetical protein [Tanacetum cinerariifolium]